MAWLRAVGGEAPEAGPLLLNQASRTVPITPNSTAAAASRGLSRHGALELGSRALVMGWLDPALLGQQDTPSLKQGLHTSSELSGLFIFWSASAAHSSSTAPPTRDGGAATNKAACAAHRKRVCQTSGCRRGEAPSQSGRQGRARSLSVPQEVVWCQAPNLPHKDLPRNDNVPSCSGMARGWHHQAVLLST